MSQYVEIQNTKSEIKNISKGVPQGFILDPLLFLFCINDMNKCDDLKRIHYTDDITAYTSNSSVDHLINHVKFELSKISDWLCGNILSLNFVKSTYTIYSNEKINTAPGFFMRGQALPQSNENKFVRIITDDKLSFGNQIDSVWKKSLWVNSCNQ